MFIIIIFSRGVAGEKIHQIGVTSHSIKFVASSQIGQTCALVIPALIESNGLKDNQTNPLNAVSVHQPKKI